MLITPSCNIALSAVRLPRQQRMMRSPTYAALLFLTLFIALAFAHPLHSPHQSSSIQRKHKHKHRHRRQFEEDLLQGAEESIELFEYPRVHDSSEQLHEHTAQQNLTTNQLLADIEEKKRKQSGMSRLPMEEEERYAYDRERIAAGLARQSGGEGGSWESRLALADRQTGEGEVGVGESR